MQPPYIPPRDSVYVLWLENFSTLITAAPATYGLAVADALAIAAVFADFAAALALATDPATRTGPTVAAKDASRAASEVVVRPYAIVIRNNAGVSNQLKLDLGLNVPDVNRTPVPAPDSNPLLDIIGATMGVHTMRFADSNTPASRKKPFGAIGLQVFRHVAVAPITDPTLAVFFGVATRQPFAVTFGSVDNGKTATYFGRWITLRGLVGPWSPPVSMTVVS